MVAWGKGSAQVAAAKALIAQDGDISSIESALSVLKLHGVHAAGSIRLFDAVVAGWTVWDGPSPPELSLGCETLAWCAVLTPQSNHPLIACGYEHAARFEMPRAVLDRSQTAALSIQGRVYCSARIAATPDPRRDFLRRAPPAPHAKRRDITIIIPIYRDLAATRACLASVVAELNAGQGSHAILVNDATPEDELAAFVDSFAQAANFTVIANPANLGFVQSVNRALELVHEGDVVLLNADSVAPPGALRRLKAIADADRTIGTLTPFSNNGEFTSFPVAFRPNPLPSFDGIIAIDQTAARVNDGQIIDVPNGIGFCLYITRPCLEAVGPLTNVFQRGYLEDVDFCLRAREHGFRNICAASVYVGHIGSRSFLTDKRALVVRNLGILESKYPDYRRECGAFLSLDPLRNARAAIEAAMLPSVAFDRLIVTAAGVVQTVVEHRALALRRRHKSALIMIVEGSGFDPLVTIKNAQHAAPQSLTFRLSDDQQKNALRKFLRGLTLSAVEFADPIRTPASLLAILLELDRPIDLCVADGGLMLAPNIDAAESRSPPATPDLTKITRRISDDWRRCWTQILRRTNDIFVPCERANAVASHMLPGRPTTLVDCAPYAIDGGARTMTKVDGSCCGVISLSAGIDEYRLLRVLARSLHQRPGSFPLVVIGQTLDDIGLMASGNVFVAGPADAADFHELFRRHRIAQVFAPLRRPLYGHPAMISAQALGLPMAYFDWRSQTPDNEESDLLLDPGLGDHDVAAALDGWVGQAG